MSSGIEPPNAQQGKGTIDSPYDQGNAPERAAGPGIEPPNAQQGKGTVDSAYDQGNQPENPPQTEQRGRSETTESGNFGAAKRDAGKNLEREVSPGQLDDGTHVKCSGDKGQSYEPATGTMGKLKGKFGIGRS